MIYMRTLILFFLILVREILPLAPPQVTRSQTMCVRWQLVSYTTGWINGPFNGHLIEYYVIFTDGRDDYQAANILALNTLSASELASFAPVGCATTAE